MIRINQPQNDNHGFIIPFPLEMLRLKKSFLNYGINLLNQFIKNMDKNNYELGKNEQINGQKVKDRKRRKIKNIEKKP